MHPLLRQCKEAITARLQGVSPIDAEAAYGDKWSIAGIIEHLDLTYSRNAAGLARRIQKGPAPERPRTLRQRIAQAVVTGLGYFPPGRDSPSAVRPQGRPLSEILAALDEHLADLDKNLNEAERVFGKRRVLDHPLLGPFTVDQWRRFHWVHTRHHMRQIDARANKPRA